MLIQSKRIYMNEADASPGNGAPAAPPAQAEPPATPAAPAPSAVSLDQVKAVVGEMLGGFKNEFFANARKAGLLKKEESAPPATPSAAAAAPSSLSVDDVKAMIARENAIARISAEHKLKPEAEKRLRDAVEFSKPDDALGYCTSFVTDLGLVRTNTEPSTTTTQTVAVVPNAAPISDRGSPTPNGVAGWKYELSTNPQNMSKGSIAAMDAELTPEVARKRRLEAAREWAQNTRVVINPRG